MIFHCYQSDPQSSNCFMLLFVFFSSPRKHIVDLLQPKGPLCITSHINRPVLLASPGCLRWVATSASTYSSVTNLTTWQMTSSSKERMGTCLSKHRVEGLGSAEDHHHWRKVMQCWMSCPKWQVCQVCKMQRDVKNASDGRRVQIQNLSEFHWEKRDSDSAHPKNSDTPFSTEQGA